LTWFYWIRESKTIVLHAVQIFCTLNNCKNHYRFSYYNATVIFLQYLITTLVGLPTATIDAMYYDSIVYYIPVLASYIYKSVLYMITSYLQYFQLVVLVASQFSSIDYSGCEYLNEATTATTWSYWLQAEIISK